MALIIIVFGIAAGMKTGWLLLVALAAPTHALLPNEDWLVGRPISQSRATFSTDPADGTMVLTNGLATRRFSIIDGQWATISLAGEEPHAETLRGVSPEARITVSCTSPAALVHRQLLDYAPDALEGKTDLNVTGSSKGSAGIAVGGLRGQLRYAFSASELWNFTRGTSDFVYSSHEVGAPSADWEWTAGARHSSNAAWPPKGVQLRVHFRAPPLHCGCYCGLRVVVVYEMYDGLPTFGKWVETSNDGAGSLLVETIVLEELHVAEHAKARMHLETNFMPRKTFWKYAQVPAADPHHGQYNGRLMNYPTWCGSSPGATHARAPTALSAQRPVLTDRGTRCV